MPEKKKSVLPTVLILIGLGVFFIGAFSTQLGLPLGIVSNQGLNVLFNGGLSEDRSLNALSVMYSAIESVGGTAGSDCGYGAWSGGTSCGIDSVSGDQDKIALAVYNALIAQGYSVYRIDFAGMSYPPFPTPTPTPSPTATQTTTMTMSVVYTSEGIATTQIVATTPVHTTANQSPLDLFFILLGGAKQALMLLGGALIIAGGLLTRRKS